MLRGERPREADEGPRIDRLRPLEGDARIREQAVAAEDQAEVVEQYVIVG